jgi:hypothetical protein
MGPNKDKPILLTAAEEKQVVEEILNISPEGLGLILSMPGGCELETATLSLSIADQNEEALTCDFTSDKGKENDNISWQIADWGGERPVIALDISPKSNDAKARIKVFHNDVWLPLTPVDIFTMGSKQSFPAVLTSKLMVEIVTELETSDKKKIPGAWQPGSASVTDTKIFASGAPCDVNLSIADEAPFFSHPGILPADVSIAVTGLKDAVNRFLDETGTTKVPLTITAGRKSQIKVNFDARAIRVAKNMAGLDSEGRLNLSWNPEDVAFVMVGKKTRVHEVEFMSEVVAGSEQLLISPESTDDVSSAHLCDLHHTAAQCFEPLPEGNELTSLELFLRPTKLPVIARLDLYADNLMQPAQQPLSAAGCEIKIEEPGENPCLPYWLPCSLPQPASLNEGPWWAVLTVETGEVHWFLSNEMPKGISRAMYRIGDGPWLQRRTYGADQKPLWSLCRLVVSRQDPPEIELLLRRNGTDTEIQLIPDPQGRVRRIADSLAKINRGVALEAEKLELVIRSNVSGSLGISNPRIRFK